MLHRSFILLGDVPELLHCQCSFIPWLPDSVSSFHDSGMDRFVNLIVCSVSERRVWQVIARCVCVMEVILQVVSKLQGWDGSHCCLDMNVKHQREMVFGSEFIRYVLKNFCRMTARPNIVIRLLLGSAPRAEIIEVYTPFL